MDTQLLRAKQEMSGRSPSKRDLSLERIILRLQWINWRDCVRCQKVQHSGWGNGDPLRIYISRKKEPFSRAEETYWWFKRLICMYVLNFNKLSCTVSTYLLSFLVWVCTSPNKAILYPLHHSLLQWCLLSSKMDLTLTHRLPLRHRRGL